MHHTRKNRSLKKNPKGLKKKSNKSSRKSKKSRRVNKRKIRGGLGLGILNKTKVPTDRFEDITEKIKNEESISQKVKMYINEKDYIDACGSILGEGERDCESNKFVGYGRRAKLAITLMESRNYDNEVHDDDKKALKGQYNEWLTLYNKHMSKHGSQKK